jgi:hypothetical protein
MGNSFKSSVSLLIKIPIATIGSSEMRRARHGDQNW